MDRGIPHVSWKFYSPDCLFSSSILNSLQWSVKGIPNNPFNEAIFIKPEKTGPLPLIIYPHGGPHSNFSNEFFLQAAVFASLGFAVALMNYTGSTGYGESCIKKLIGNIGSFDVRDCHV